MRKDHSSWTPRRPPVALEARQSACIPSQVVQVVPSCAITCLESFIQTQYSTSCANTSSLTFLCVTPNPSGFALGEAALRCVVSNCSSTSSEGSVYNICAGIMGSVPETRATITATVAQTSLSGSILIMPMTSSMLPPTIAPPLITPALLTFVSAAGSPVSITPTKSASTSVTGSPSIGSTTPAPTASSPTPSPPITFSTSGTPSLVLSTTSSTTQMNPEAASTTAASVGEVQRTALPTGAVAGIAVGGFALAAALSSLLFFLFCLRKKRKTKRSLSQSFSVGAFPLPPAGKDIQQVSTIPAPALTPNQRFYASAAPEEERKSIWKKSINPVDIGVALSPGKIEQASPKSVASDKSASGLLANGEEPSMWPSPLMNFPPPPKAVPRRPGNTVPTLDEQQASGPVNSNPTYSVHAPYETRLSRPPQQLTQASYSRPFNNGPTVSIEAPYETRLSRPPQQLTQASYSRPFGNGPTVSIEAPYETRLTRLPHQMASARVNPPPAVSQDQAYNAERARGAAITGRIPLTPIYDNGNFATASQGRMVPVAYRWDTPESMDQLSQPVPPASTRAPIGLNITNGAVPDGPPRKNSYRSVTSESTIFEEETTPEEERERQLKLAQSQSQHTSQYSNERRDALARIPEGDGSPIKHIAYPQVPRPAAVSRQAQEVPRPLAGQEMNTSQSPGAGMARGLSRRYELNRAAQSYLLSEGSSSSSSNPSLLAQRRIGQQKDLRIKTPNAATNALNSRWQVSAQPQPASRVAREVPITKLQTRPSLKDKSPKSKVTPKTNSRGDLYLTVEG